MDECNWVKPYKRRSQDYETLYTHMSTTCSLVVAPPAGVLCVKDSIRARETCGINEFRCGNNVCISIEQACDGIPDCADASDELDCPCGTDAFTCDNGRCVSISLYCDVIDHCGDNSDEETCVPEECDATEFRCGTGECIDSHRLCDLRRDCSDGSDEHEDLCDGRCRGFLCYSGRCLHSRLVDDGITDCPGLSGEDEIKDDIAIDVIGCDEGGSFTRCRDGAQCYDRSRACQFATNVLDDVTNYKTQSHCRDGSHLRRNCASVECPGMYHCPGSYCIAVPMLCNGVPDCPGGEDELGCDKYICQGMLKCRGSSICVPRSAVCDGVNDCPLHGEDEKYCGNIDILCGMCDCHGYVANCTGQSLARIPFATETTRRLRALLLSDNAIVLPRDSFVGLHWLGRLALSRNELQLIPKGLFRDLHNLVDLDLSFNLLTELHGYTFQGLRSLASLNIGHNKLSSLKRQTLFLLPALKTLILTDNKLDGILEDTFADSLILEVLETDAYKFCCIAPHVEKCTPEADEFSSCEDLMANFALQISIWVLGCVAFIGNAFVVVWRMKTDRQRVSSFFIINLGLSDWLMGVYLLIIASVDVFYRGRYIIYANSWRSSALCQLAGVLAMLSSEMSVFTLTAITLDRVRAIVYPLTAKVFTLRKAMGVAAAGWAGCLFISLLPISRTAYFGNAFFGRTGVCLPIVVSNERDAGWEYSVFIILVLNLCSFLAILISYIAIFLTVKTSARTLGSAATNTVSEYDLAKRLALIIVTDFLCWVPIILVGFAALGGARVDPQVSAWIAVFILPLNSAVNPLLYTMSVIDWRRSGRRQHRGPGVAMRKINTAKICGTQNKAAQVSENRESSSSSTVTRCGDTQVSQIHDNISYQPE